MKRYGNPNLKTARIDSNRYASDKSFNKLVVNSLSEVDQGTLDHEVVIFNKEDDKIYTYEHITNSWKSWDEIERHEVSEHVFPVVYIDTGCDEYNQFLMTADGDTHIAIHKDAFDVGPNGAQIDFVLDFWLEGKQDEFDFGTILYNGMNAGPMDIDQNRNLLITSSGSELIQDPNFQTDPTLVTHIENDAYINVFRPQLRSQTKIIRSQLTHIALIRSGDTTYLAIEGRIEDSAPSVEYFHYDDLLVGGGYIGGHAGNMINLRVTRNTDLGWTTDFTPPNHNITPDANTHFLMDSSSLVDTVGGHEITAVGDAPTITKNRFYFQLNYNDHNNSTIATNLDHNDLRFRLPNENIVIDVVPNSGKTMYVECNVATTLNGQILHKIVCDKSTTIQRIDGQVFIPYWKKFPRRQQYPSIESNRVLYNSVPVDTTYLKVLYIPTSHGVYSWANNGTKIKPLQSYEFIEQQVDIEPLSSDSPQPFKITSLTKPFNNDTRYCTSSSYTVQYDAVIRIPSGWNTTVLLVGSNTNYYDAFRLTSARQLQTDIYASTYTHPFVLDVDHWYHIRYWKYHVTANVKIFDLEDDGKLISNTSQSTSVHSSYYYLYQWYYPSDLLYNMIRFMHRSGGNYSFPSPYSDVYLRNEDYLLTSLL